METKPNVQIIELLSRVMEDVGSVRKGERNQAQNFNFRGIDAVVNAVSPVLRKHGVVVTPEVQSMEYTTVEVGKNRTTMGHARVTVTYKFYAPDGTFLPATVCAESMDSGDKATAKAMSVAFRTCLLQTLVLPTDDIDPDHDVYERSVPASKPASSRGMAPVPEKKQSKMLTPLSDARVDQFKDACEAKGLDPKIVLHNAGIPEGTQLMESHLPAMTASFKDLAAFKAGE